MILDNTLMFADKLDYDGTPATLDLSRVKPGPGEPIRVFFVAHTVLTACTGVQVLDAAVAPADEDLILVEPIPVTGEIFTFTLPSTTLQFVTIDLVGTVSAGNFSCGIILDGGQTNL